MIREISLIIPNQNAEKKILYLLKSIKHWQIIPNEIIIIDSSKKKLVFSKDFELFAKQLNIRSLMIYEKNLYPGHARNIGINNASNSLLAFLDTSTYPNNQWLSSGLELIKAQNSDGVWGNTFYEADTFMSKIFRACTFGAKPIRTFPGSILKKNIFNRCGLFIETTRAGEDGDWISRAELQKINMSTTKEFLKYDGLNSISMKNLIKKWFRNYTHTAKLPFFSAHKNYYYYSISFISILLAYNWNRVIAAWDRESIFFIPNITTISIILIFTSYIFIRSILLPRKKGVDLGFIFPINFIFIAFFSALLDLSKTLAFIYAKFSNKLK